LGERRQVRGVGDEEAAAEITPEPNAELLAGFPQAEEGVAAVATLIGAGAAGDFAFDHLAADVVFGAVGVQRDLRSIEGHQQFGLVGVQPGEPPVEGDEAGAGGENAVPGTRNTTFL
jgi:hypothetical protein